MATSKKTKKDDDIISENCDAIVFFQIYAQIATI